MPNCFRQRAGCSTGLTHSWTDAEGVSHLLFQTNIICSFAVSGGQTPESPETKPEATQSPHTLLHLPIGAKTDRTTKT